MWGLRTVARAIAVMAIATPLFGQSAGTVRDTIRDTSALARLPAHVTAVAPAIVVDVRPAAPQWTTLQAATAPVLHNVATWSNGDGSHAIPAAMMIVGGSGLLVGTVVSGKPGTSIMIGSGILGLVGWWRYTK